MNPIIPIGELTRRHFCQVAGVAAACAGLMACSPGGSAQSLVQTGPLDENGNPTGDDHHNDDPDSGMATGQHDASVATGQHDASVATGQHDASVATGQHDASVVTTPPDSGTVSGATCPANVRNVGSAASFAMGSATYVSGGNFFVMRDAGGLYAMSAACTHAGATIQKKTSNFYCPRHGATFSLTGAPVSGPVFTALTHYAMCSLGGDMVGVDTGHSAAATARLNM